MRLKSLEFQRNLIGMEAGTQMRLKRSTDAPQHTNRDGSGDADAIET